MTHSTSAVDLGDPPDPGGLSVAGTLDGHHLKHHSKQDWDQMRPKIEELYIDSRLSLPKVIEVLSREPYNFHAT